MSNAPQESKSLLVWRILIVDDQDFERITLRRKLEAVEGIMYQIDEAENKQIAFDKLGEQDFNYDAIIIDISLSDPNHSIKNADGLDIARKVGNIPKIIMSEYDWDAETIAEMHKSLGPNAVFVPKNQGSYSFEITKTLKEFRDRKGKDKGANADSKSALDETLTVAKMTTRVQLLLGIISGLVLVIVALIGAYANIRSADSQIKLDQVPPGVITQIIQTYEVHLQTATQQAAPPVPTP